MMEVHFQINYCTVWGEDVRVKMIQKNGVESIFPLSTADGKSWTGKLSVSGDIKYQYCLFSQGRFSRSEWDINVRTISDDGKGRAIYTFDAWRDKADMSYFFSSAFTDCVRNEPAPAKVPAKEALFSRTLRINVTAPQLEDGQVLAMSGNQAALGNWDINKGIMLKKDADILGWYVQLDASKLTFPLEYKFYAVDKKSHKLVDWESSMNRSIANLSIQEKEVYVFSDTMVYFSRPRWKGAGVAIPVFSLKTEKSFGVGDFGDLKKMVDWAALTHQRIVQILPINDTTITHTWSDSYPYSSISIYALHPMYMNLPALGKLADKKKMAEFNKKQKELNNLTQVDYEAVNNAKWEYIRLMFAQEGEKVLASAAFGKFYKESEAWLMPYAVFSYLRDKFGTADFHLWGEYQIYNKDKVAKLCSPQSKTYSEIALYYYVQFNLHCQLLDASAYARRSHVILKGDIPIGISRNSVEAWAEPHYFNLNGQAGAPPDDFSVKGQNWGFPTYNWDEMAKDDYQWWKRRFRQMAQYFDAYRIDHILGFFRIWEIPTNAVHGLLGQFSPALPMSVEEIQHYGLWFRQDFFTRPFINDHVVGKVFGEHAEEVKKKYLHATGNGMYEMLPQYDTQRKVEAAFYGKSDDKSNWLREGLYSLISDVLFVPDRKNSQMYHPRIAVQFDFIFEALSWEEKEAFNRLYNDYYYHRHNDFWYHEAMKKLPCLIGATRMLVCGEDLGMVPDCVESVMNQLQILSLELQRMPKSPKNEFGHVNEYPYLSVCTFSSHDTSTLRGWWEEDLGKTARFYHNELHQQGDIPAFAPGWACKMIVGQQLNSNSMLCILSFQDWLSIDEKVRFQNAPAERINVPANPRHYWRYRIHLTLEELMKCDELNEEIRQMIDNCGRNMK
jgi:4-alpha-glucanotransferase